MKTSDFDYTLPAELIAQTPVEPRDASRLMVVHRAAASSKVAGQIEHRMFRDVGEYLQPGDLLVLNQTRVIPARLFGHKAETGGRVELLLLARHDEHTWEALVRGKGLRPGTLVRLQAPGPGARPAVVSANDLRRDEEPLRGTKDATPNAEHALPNLQYPMPVMAHVVAETETGSRLIRFDRPIGPLLDALGTVPLPPYIHRPLADPERYQTVYGRIRGSVAASTAGLHFTPELLVDLRRMGVEMAFVTLHIGLDTFRPVKEEEIEEHQIHTEWYELTAQVAAQINHAHLEGRRVIAVGTTVVRALESSATNCAVEGEACAWRTVSAYSGPTGLFIYPGYRFRVVEAMITNFHLPRSTLLMLVSAFAGRELIFRAYQEAIQRRYRFFSFGDAMLLL
jgi:S-adenosylmethionine:tRNA ribosyltransferase-isomerase